MRIEKAVINENRFEPDAVSVGLASRYVSMLALSMGEPEPPNR
jgi:hypothetical protein